MRSESVSGRSVLVVLHRVAGPKDGRMLPNTGTDESDRIPAVVFDIDGSSS